MDYLKKWVWMVCMILVSATSSWGQTSTQTVKGVVIDRSNQQTLTGANITLVDSEPVRGTTTDINGRFELRDIPLGRHSLRVSYLGYETAIVAHFLVTSAREVHLEIELRRAAQETEEVLV
nr:carboxypeptidase-like regulatory domain-containing protein [Saprospiraceae bacterium]